MGNNQHGQLGIGDKTLVEIGNPTLVPGLMGEKIRDNFGTIASLSLGQYHSIALTTKGEIFTWGQGQYGALGTGSTDDEFSPVWVNQGFSEKFA